MTTAQLKAYYANLLPSQWRALPKANATMQVLAQFGLMQQGGTPTIDQNGNYTRDQNQDATYDQFSLTGVVEPILPLAVAQAFSLGSAVGQQLQFLGTALGVKNAGYNLSNIWTVLTESDYRTLIQIVQSRNNLRGAWPNILGFILQYFPGMSAVNNLNQSITFTYTATLGQYLPQELFITAGLLPTPLGYFGSLVIS